MTHEEFKELLAEIGEMWPRTDQLTPTNVELWEGLLRPFGLLKAQAAFRGHKQEAATFPTMPQIRARLQRGLSGPSPSAEARANPTWPDKIRRMLWMVPGAGEWSDREALLHYHRRIVAMIPVPTPRRKAHERVVAYLEGGGTGPHLDILMSGGMCNPSDPKKRQLEAAK